MPNYTEPSTPSHARTVREFAMRRQRGASSEARVRVHKAQAEMIWEGTCRVCGGTVTGTLSELYKRCPSCSTKGAPHA